MPRKADQALRRAIVDLASLEPDEAMSILDMLEPEQRKSVESLLKEYSGSAPQADASPASYNSAGLSPWLARRLESSEGINPEALATLRECAARLLPASHTVEAVLAAQPSLMSRLGSVLRAGAGGR